MVSTRRHESETRSERAAKQHGPSFMTILACTFRLRDARVQEAGVSEVTVHFEQKKSFSATKKR